MQESEVGLAVVRVAGGCSSSTFRTKLYPSAHGHAAARSFSRPDESDVDTGSSSRGSDLDEGDAGVTGRS